MKSPHTHFKRGKRLRIVLRDGTVLVRRFYERSSRDLIVDGDDGTREKLRSEMLRNVSIYKGGKDERCVKGSA